MIESVVVVRVVIWMKCKSFNDDDKNLFTLTCFISPVLAEETKGYICPWSTGSRGPCYLDFWAYLWKRRGISVWWNLIPLYETEYVAKMQYALFNLISLLSQVFRVTITKIMVEFCHWTSISYQHSVEQLTDMFAISFCMISMRKIVPVIRLHSILKVHCFWRDFTLNFWQPVSLVVRCLFFCACNA